MPSEDIALAVKDTIDVAVLFPALDGAPPSEVARQDDSNGSKEGVRVLFRDEEEYKRKLERMVADGAHQLQVIAGPLLQVVVAAKRCTQTRTIPIGQSCCTMPGIYERGFAAAG